MKNYKLYPGIRKLIAFQLILLLFNNCTLREKEKPDIPHIKIDLNSSIPENGKLSDVAERIEYIFLETNDSSLLGTAGQIVITESNIVVRDDERVLIFDTDGNFLRNLFKVGRGPDEASARFITFNDIDRSVFVYTNTGRDIKEFDLSGRLNRSFAPPVSENPNSIIFFKGNLLIATRQSPTTKSVYYLYDYKRDSILFAYNNPNPYPDQHQGKYPSLILADDYLFQVKDKELLLKERFCDTIFSLNKTGYSEPFLIMDIKGLMKWEDWREVMFNVSLGPIPGFWLQSFFESESYFVFYMRSFTETPLLFFQHKGNQSIKVFSSTKTNKSSDNIIIKNDLDNLADISPLVSGKMIYSDNCIYCIVDAKELRKAYQEKVDSPGSLKLSRQTEEAIKQLDEFSNPVIMKVHLK